MNLNSALIIYARWVEVCIMNKYQRAILENQDTKVFYTCSSVKNHAPTAADFDYDTDKYQLIQEEDIFSTQYEFIVKANSNIESCEFCINGEWHTAERKEGNFLLVLDFNSRTEKIKLSFADNIADDYIFSVQYVEADKDLYYQKQEADRKANMLQSAQIKHSTGTDLINIYFQPCCSDYEYTEIYLYIPQDYVTEGGPYGPVKKPSSWQLFKKCKVPSEDFYKSINGLAYGTYAYIIKQFDKKDNLLLETEYIEFSLKTPKQPIMGRINRI